jgi:hypothetical protein
LTYGKNGNDVSISLSSNEIEKVKSIERRRKSKRKSTKKDKNKDIIKTSPPVIEKTVNTKTESVNNIVSPEVVESSEWNTSDNTPLEITPYKSSFQNYLNNPLYSNGYDSVGKVQDITC